MTDCVFCGIVSGDVPSVKVAETASTYAFMDINPANDGHLLVIPKQHSTDLLDIGADDLSAVTLEAQRIAQAMVDDAGADGVNLLNCCKAPAWQTVFHFHLHVIPRYADRSVDRLSLPWQPGVAGDRVVMSEYAETLATALR
ncbi:MULTISPECIES: HIT family protein [unclassified Gordonia (in: high G+C Gram-positive bacteria)]|uniref:HIT family protein n=1 Tax=unclassified Gordonia (in: high G+C Gram-positive bacteria) TaxID=2657482 RepID=UPI0007EBB8DF|nr:MULTISPECIES: HIT family protein [unclassified Gordonia (in: high G+C Gram-positive bacteria)]OBC05563.1 HIT family hydrolase [Gordonia sp. 852002-50395_SCH5434458]OBC13784.1 HIT family hydrolase [Gordonia sp. 852002-50816_SCH5313054-a]OBC14666.1 HIT family hydrolase [Gordonia sp. 852002-50816_SCH5313054-c]